MIPAKYQNADYETIPQQVKEKFKEVLKTSSKGIYLHGECGTGKTHIMYAIYKKYNLVNPQSKAIFWNVTDLLQEIKSDFDKPNMEKMRPEERILASQDLLFLDDIGAEKMSDWVAEKFYTIINTRYEKMLPTFFTSNLRIGELKDRIGERAVSRIIEMCEIIELSGIDKRMEHLKKTHIQL